MLAGARVAASEQHDERAGQVFLEEAELGNGKVYITPRKSHGGGVGRARARVTFGSAVREPILGQGTLLQRRALRLAAPVAVRRVRLPALASGGGSAKVYLATGG